VLVYRLTRRRDGIVRGARLALRRVLARIAAVPRSEPDERRDS
jgi:hypothetical protein